MRLNVELQKPFELLTRGSPIPLSIERRNGCERKKKHRGVHRGVTEEDMSLDFSLPTPRTSFLQFA